MRGPPPPPCPHCGLSPFASGVSGFSLESAAARLTPEGAAELTLPTLGDVDARVVVPTLRGAAGSVFAGGLRAGGDTGCGSLADGPACGPSPLGRPLEAEAVAGAGLWVRERVSGTGGSRNPSHDASRSPSVSPQWLVPMPTLLGTV